MCSELEGELIVLTAIFGIYASKFFKQIQRWGVLSRLNRGENGVEFKRQVAWEIPFGASKGCLVPHRAALPTNSSS